ncbi:MAG: TIGR03435 family protein [Bryobacteraceae bacterium]
MPAQSPAARPELEVASIKLNTGGGGRGGMRVTPGRLRAENLPLRTLIRNAYKVPTFTISGGPGWIDSDRYDIEAKAEGDLQGDAALLLLRTILEDRFQLKVHRETREGLIYVLTVAKGGPKLPPSNCLLLDPGHLPPTPPPGEQIRNICGLNKGGGSGPSRLLNVVGLKMDEPNTAPFPVPGFTFYLSSIVERTVIDKTGLTGRFDIRLEYAPESPSAAAPDDPDKLAPLADTAPSIFAAVQQQLGLKLESTKGPVEVLVIDHVGRPSEN